jgi:DNA-binding NtrC family response regulator
MLTDYVVTIPKKSAEPLDAANIGQVGSERLVALLLESAQRDPILRQRLREIIGIPSKPMPRSAAASVKEDAKEEAPAPAGSDTSSGYMVGASPAMLRLFEAIRRYATSSAPVLIMGESGTGKELAARAIHERSVWGKGPFVAINCGALPTTLIASELFGYEKGAFTGAAGRRIGRIESAEGGTVFLDEIGDLPLETQVHLLRFLQEKTIERVGGNTSITVNSRIIAATNVNLRDAVAKGRFREDLYYRLNVLNLVMPPLRERGDDIMLLARFFLQQFSKEIGCETSDFSADAQATIMAHPWPGNVRELIACVRRAVVMADGPSIRASNLGIVSGEIEHATSERGLGKVRAEAEAHLVRSALEHNRFHVKKTASELGVSRVTLYRLIQKYDIKIDRRAL